MTANIKKFGPLNLLFLTGILVLMATMLLGGASFFLILSTLFTVIAIEYLYDFRRTQWLSYYTYFILSPVLLLFYTSVRDFNIRIFIFIFFAFMMTFVRNSSRSSRLSASLSRLNTLSYPKIWLIAFLIFFVTSLLLYNKGVYLAGDEPHFLSIAQSIVDDGDFDLKNNYSEASYFILKPELDGTGWKIAPHITMHDGYTRSFHMPGVSFLMLPFYLVFKWTGYAIHPAIFFRLATTLINAFFAMGIFMLFRLYFKDREIFPFWLMIITSFPFLFHSTTIFPEIPAAMMTLFIFIFGFTRYKNYLLAGLFLAFLPWFHVKHYPVVMVFSLALLFKIFNEWKGDRNPASIIKFLVFPGFSLILLMLYCKVLYGTINPALIFPKQNYFVDYFLKIKVFFAYFLDQKDGLLTYGPFLFLLFFGLKRKFDYRYLLLFAAGIYVTLHAFTTVRGAYAPAGRPLVFVLWIFLLFTAQVYFSSDSRHSLGRYIFRFLMGLSYFFTLWFFYYPFFMFQPVFSATKNRASDLFNFLSSDSIYLPSLLPSFITHPDGTHLPNLLWIPGLFLLMLFFYLRKGDLFSFEIRNKKVITAAMLMIFSVLTYLFASYPHVQLDQRNRFLIDSIPIYKTAKLFHYIEDIEKGHQSIKRFRLKEGFVYDLYIDLNQAKNRHKKLLLSFDANQETRMTIETKNSTLFQTEGKQQFRFSINLSKLRTIQINNRRFGHLSLKTNQKSDEQHIYLNISRLP